MHEWGGLTRFAKSEIHQSTFREDTGLRVRVVANGRVGVARRTTATPEGARKAARARRRWPRSSAADPMWPGLAPVADVPPVDGRSTRPPRAGRPRRAPTRSRTLIGRCEPGFAAAGAYETQAVEVGVANTEGQFCWAPSTQASLTTVVTGGDGGSGFAETFAGAVDDDRRRGDRRAGERRRRCAPRRRARSMPACTPWCSSPRRPPRWSAFLACMGFARTCLRRGPVLLQREGGPDGGRAVVSTVGRRRPTRARSGAPFDFEGVPKRRVDLVEGGVFRDAVYDLRTAKQAGVDGSTGHGLPSPNPEGPFPLNLFMGTGDATVEEMVAATERGVLVTRFHYSNIVNPMESSITGMTRDGTFLIERRRDRGAGAQLPVHAVDPRGALEHLDDRARGRARERVLLQRLARARR